MIEIKDFDMTRLQVRNAQMVKQLGLSERQVVATTTRQLLQEIIDGLPPKSATKAKHRADWAVRKSFYALPRANQSNFIGSRKAGLDATAWIYASPTLLVGAPRWRLAQKSADVLLDERKTLMHTKNWSDVGKRGSQRVMIVNKPVISQAMAATLQKLITGKFGKMKASFAQGFVNLNMTLESGALKIQAWVKIHIGTGKARGRGINNLNEQSPSITIISNATGIESERAIKIIKGAVIGRAAKMKKDLENQLSGVYKRAGYSGNQ